MKEKFQNAYRIYFIHITLIFKCRLIESALKQTLSIYKDNSREHEGRVIDNKQYQRKVSNFARTCHILPKSSAPRLDSPIGAELGLSAAPNSPAFMVP